MASRVSGRMSRRGDSSRTYGAVELSQFMTVSAEPVVDISSVIGSNAPKATQSGTRARTYDHRCGVCVAFVLVGHALLAVMLTVHCAGLLSRFAW